MKQKLIVKKRIMVTDKSYFNGSSRHGNLLSVVLTMSGPKNGTEGLWLTLAELWRLPALTRPFPPPGN